MSEVSREQVERVAELANLQLTAQEIPRMQRDLNAILGHIAQLAELDTADVEPMAQVEDILRAQRDAAGETLRRDTVAPSVDRKAVMAEAPESDGRFFKVPRVLDR